MKFLARFLSLVLLVGSSIAYGQPFSSRPTFLSAGIGCSPSLWAQNALSAPGANGFLCVGGYPQSTGGDGRIYFFNAADPLDAYSYIRAGEITNPGLDFHLVEMGGDVTVGFFATDLISFGDADATNNIQFSTAGAVNIYGTDDAGNDLATITLNADQSLDDNKYAFQLTTDGAGSGQFRFGAWDSASALFADVHSDLSFNETTGEPSFWFVNVPAVVFDTVTNGAMIQTNGGSGAPPYSFFDDSNSGIYSSAADAVSIATAGSDQLTIGTTSVSIQNNTLISSGATVTVDDSLHATGNLSFDGTCADCVAASGVYGGYVDDAAAAENVPTGWSASVASTCIFTVTHNLGLGTFDDLAVSLTVHSSGQNTAVTYTSGTANAFTYTTSNAAGDSCDAHDAFFTAIVVSN